VGKRSVSYQYYRLANPIGGNRGSRKDYRRLSSPLIGEDNRQLSLQILNFHADNGSEYINQKVATMLNKLLIKLIKGRPRHSNDNALVETKNGWVLRKCLGYSHIKQEHAQGINYFYFGCFNMYLNLHCPCAFPMEVMDKKRKD